MSFDGDISRFARLTVEAHDKITRTATLDLFSGVIRSTPVDKGAARGGWQTSVGQGKDGQNDRLDPSGGAAIAEVEAITPPGAGQVTFLSNNLPYIGELERGSSTKAPEGMIRINMDRVKRIVDAAVRRHRV